LLWGLHRGNGGGRAGRSAERGEGGLSTSLLDVVEVETRGNVGLNVGPRGSRNDLRAVDHVSPVLAEERELDHGIRKSGLNLVLII
jgi:hypothetical protein